MPATKNPQPFKIVVSPARVLRAASAHIPARDIASPRIQRLIASLKETLAATPDGVGLAAPQVGEALRVFIVSEEAEEIDRAQRRGWERRQRADAELNEPPYEKRPWNYYVFINPALKNSSRRRLADPPEGCLSVPGKFGTVLRHEKITVEAYDEHGRKFIRHASRFLARVVQHELDHLNGILFIDKAKDLVEMRRAEAGERTD